MKARLVLASVLLASLAAAVEPAYNAIICGGGK